LETIRSIRRVQQDNFKMNLLNKGGLET